MTRRPVSSRPPGFPTIRKDCAAVMRDVNPGTIKAYVQPGTTKRSWFFEISATNATGDELWSETGLNSYGYAMSKGRAERKAQKRIAKMRKRYGNLQRHWSIVE